MILYRCLVNCRSLGITFRLEMCTGCHNVRKRLKRGYLDGNGRAIAACVIVFDDADLDRRPVEGAIASKIP